MVISEEGTSWNYCETHPFRVGVLISHSVVCLSTSSLPMVSRGECLGPYRGTLKTASTVLIHVHTSTVLILDLGILS